MKKKLFIYFTIILTSFSIYANNLRISAGQKVDVAGDDNQVRFSIAWDNSWRVVGEPSNYDAVWLFVKYRKCGLNEKWQHGLLSTNMSDHTIPANLVADNILTADRNGNDTGNQYDFTGHNTGIMVYRSDFNKNNIPVSEITLTINGTGLGDKPFKDGDEYEIRVIGIEMVFVPENEFWLGEDYADIIPEADNSFYRSVSVAPISSEAAIPDAYYQDTWDQQPLPATYPKGFRSFYCMKYEITQGQFRNFLDTSKPITGDPNNPEAFSGQNRNNLQYNTTPDRAQNYLNWTFLKTYLDWACLRPMTELEYEKACVGPIEDRDNGIYAWGTTTIIKADYLTGPEDGTEKVATLNANCNYRKVIDIPIAASQRPSGYIDVGWTGGVFASYNMETLSSPDCEQVVSAAIFPNLTGGSEWMWRTWHLPIMICGSRVGQGHGPIGVGIFARDNTLTREQTGATYYGIMEMSGNVWEQCINVRHGTVNEVPNYSGIWGNGVLNASGYSDVPEWNTYANSRALRGGSCGDDATYQRTFDRRNYDYQNETASWGIGGRGVR